MKLGEMRGAARRTAIRIVGRRLAERTGFPNPVGMEDAAFRLFVGGRLKAAGISGDSEWSEVVPVLERMLGEAVASGEVPRSQPPKKARASVGRDGWHEARHQDDGGFFRKGSDGE